MHHPALSGLLLCLLLAFLPAHAEWRLVSQNLNRFFDAIDDPEDDRVLSAQKYRKRVAQLAKRIIATHDQPDVLAFQEIEKKAILEAVASAVENAGGRRYRALLIDGNDRSGMDVGYLVAEELDLRRVEPLFAGEHYRYKKNGRQVSAPLFARPPLLIEFCRERCITLVNVHLRSMRGLRHPVKGRRIALKRQLQAETLARWVQDLQAREPDTALAVVGDFNALTPSDRFVDVIGTLLGRPDTERPARVSPDLVEPDLIDASRDLPGKKRYSYRYKRRKQLLDYLLLNRVAAGWLRSIRYGWIDYRVSDHSALTAEFDQP